jgi:putative hydrolase of the HAD superfamily
MPAVTFDFGQTLAELDTVMLAERLAERGVSASVAALEAARPAMWRRYNEAIGEGLGGHPWALLMATLLRCAPASCRPAASCTCCPQRLPPPPPPPPP